MSDRSGPALIALDVADDLDAWAALGFAVERFAVRLGQVELRFDGSAAPTGIVGWSFGEPAGRPGPPSAHPNGVTGIDHVVVMASDLDRTLARLDELGLEPRRHRDTTIGGRPARQTFLWAGSTIIEVVSPGPGSGPAGEPDRPDTFFGLAVVSDDLDATAAFLGDRLGPARDAVQPGRRIASIRSRAVGIATQIAVMTPHDRVNGT